MSPFRSSQDDDGGRVIDVGQIGRSALGKLGTIVGVLALVILFFWSVVTVPAVPEETISAVRVPSVAMVQLAWVAFGLLQCRL